MIEYRLDETLDQAIMNLAIEHESGLFGVPCIDTSVAVADVILSNGKKAQVQIKITTDDFEFVSEDYILPLIDLSAGRQVKP
jgi:hypothetical protein